MKLIVSRQNVTRGKFYQLCDDGMLFSTFLPVDIFECLRPDLALEPGGGPIEVESLDPEHLKTVVAFDCGWQSAADELEEVKRQRDGLVAAAKKIVEFDSPSCQVFFGDETWGTFVAAIAACEEKS